MAQNLFLFFPHNIVMDRAMRRETVFRDRSNPPEIYSTEDILRSFLFAQGNYPEPDWRMKKPQHPSVAKGLHCIEILCSKKSPKCFWWHCGSLKSSVSWVVHRVSRALSDTGSVSQCCRNHWMGHMSGSRCLETLQMQDGFCLMPVNYCII